MAVCSFYQRGACKFGGKPSAVPLSNQTHINQIPANTSTLEVREMRTVAEPEAASADQTTTALVPSMATAIVLAKTADPTHLEVIEPC